MADINNAITHIQGSNGDRYEIGDSLTQAEIQEICAGVTTEGGTLPIASGTGLGCIKIGNGLNITSDGVLSTAQNSVTPIGAGGTDATNAAAARINLGFEYGDEIPTTTPSTGNGAVYFFEDELNVIPISEGGTDAVTADEALANLGGIKIELLWENAAITSSFEAQDIIMNDTADIYILFFNNSTSNFIARFSILRKDQVTGNFFQVASANSTSINYYTRYFSINETVVGFENCYRKTMDSTTAGTTAYNTYGIPVAIYGIKGVV